MLVNSHIIYNSLILVIMGRYPHNMASSLMDLYHQWCHSNDEKTIEHAPNHLFKWYKSIHCHSCCCIHSLWDNTRWLPVDPSAAELFVQQTHMEQTCITTQIAQYTWTTLILGRHCFARQWYNATTSTGIQYMAFVARAMYMTHHYRISHTRNGVKEKSPPNDEMWAKYTTHI